VWAIGNEGGFLPAPVNLTLNHNNQLLMGLAERADIIVDFTNVPVGNYVLGNVGPDEPFKGFNADGTLADGAGGALPPADPATTGQVMQFQVVAAAAPDPTTPPANLVLPAITPLPAETVTRPLALIEMMSASFDAPAEAVLGNVAFDPNTGVGTLTHQMWMDPVTENPMPGDTEVWEFYNSTADAHPMHIHEITFEVVNRQPINVLTDAMGMPTGVELVPNSVVTPPAPWEAGFKDTVTAYPGMVTRVRAQYTTPGQFVWHCHIVEHEDNEMMRPYRIGAEQPGQPGAMPPM
jgi:FtsP/CotA-like multicopper oxidase with cupredoxin domain